ncbi:MAG: hypothetical protein NVS2B7_04190 [Herpetosiphon sp.]
MLLNCEHTGLIGGAVDHQRAAAAGCETRLQSRGGGDHRIALVPIAIDRDVFERAVVFALCARHPSQVAAIKTGEGCQRTETNEGGKRAVAQGFEIWHGDVMPLKYPDDG